MNQPWVYTCSPSWTPFPPPSPPHLSGSSHCTSPKHPVCFSFFLNAPQVTVISGKMCQCFWGFVYSWGIHEPSWECGPAQRGIALYSLSTWLLLHVTSFSLFGKQLTRSGRLMWAGEGRKPSEEVITMRLSVHWASLCPRGRAGHRVCEAICPPGSPRLLWRWWP